MLIAGTKKCVTNNVFLKKNKIKHIVSLFGNKPKTISKNITWRKFKFEDTLEFPSKRRFVNEFKKLQKVRGNILVHCNIGRVRTRAFMIGFFMFNKKISFEKAVDKLKKKLKMKTDPIKQIRKRRVTWILFLKLYFE